MYLSRVSCIFTSPDAGVACISVCTYRNTQREGRRRIHVQILALSLQVNALTEASKVLGEPTLRSRESSVRSFKRFLYSLENSWKDPSTDSVDNAKKKSWSNLLFSRLKDSFPIKIFEIGLSLVSILNYEELLGEGGFIFCEWKFRKCGISFFFYLKFDFRCN